MSERCLDQGAQCLRRPLPGRMWQQPQTNWRRCRAFSGNLKARSWPRRSNVSTARPSLLRLASRPSSRTGIASLSVELCPESIAQPGRQSAAGKPFGLQKRDHVRDRSAVCQTSRVMLVWQGIICRDQCLQRVGNVAHRNLDESWLVEPCRRSRVRKKRSKIARVRS